MNDQPELIPSSEPRAPMWAACIGGRRGLVLACVISALFAAAAFAPSMRNQFVYDDHSIIERNPAVNVEAKDAKPVPWYRLWLEPYWPRFISADKLYRPLTSLSLRANAAIGGQPLEPWRFRVVNVGLHVLTSIGVVVLAWRLTRSAAAAALAGVLFAAHPVHTEAVVPIYGRSEVMAGCFGAWLLARHLADSRSGPPRSSASLVISPLLFLGAVMSKEHGMFLWPVLMAIDLWHRRDPTLPASRLGRREWFNRVFAPAHVGYALAAAVFLFFRYLVFGWKTHLEASRTRIYEVPMAHVGLVEHLLTPFRLLSVVAKNLFATESLCPIWSYPALSPADRLYADVLAGMALAAVIVVLIGYLWHRREVAGALLIGMVFTLAIPIQAIPVARWFYAERWLYLPTVLIAVLIAAGVRKLGRAAAIGGLAAGFLLLPQSWQYATKFADNLTMQREVIVRQPHNFQGRRCYASALYLQGSYTESVQAANQLIERFGPVSDAYKLLLLSYLELGDGRRALAAIEKYESLRLEYGEPGLTEQRQRAHDLIKAESERNSK